jgi:hypothetical protein
MIHATDRDQLIKDMVQNTEDFVEEVMRMDCILNHKIEPMPDTRIWQPFVEVHIWTHATSVNVFEVVGTGHPDYAGISWIEMLIRGKRMPVNLPLLQNNPDYYFSRETIEPPITYLSLNDKTYIHYDGNHRTAIAKALYYFLGKREIGLVEWHRYFVDFQTVNLVRHIQKRLNSISPALRITPENRTKTRQDAAGWMMERFDLRFVVENREKSKSIVLQKDELVLFLSELQRFRSSWFKRLMPRNRYTELF